MLGSTAVDSAALAFCSQAGHVVRQVAGRTLGSSEKRRRESSWAGHMQLASLLAGGGDAPEGDELVGAWERHGDDDDLMSCCVTGIVSGVCPGSCMG